MNDGNPELSELTSWDKRPRQIINQSNDKKIKLFLQKTQEQTRLNIRYTKKVRVFKR